MMPVKIIMEFIELTDGKLKVKELNLKCQIFGAAWFGFFILSIPSSNT